MRIVTVQIRQDDDLKVIDSLLRSHNLRPLDEREEQREPGQQRRITYTFATVDEMGVAISALARYVP
jgi:hypothetical protein